MPVIVSNAQIQLVKGTLASVKSNAQALAACEASIRAAKDLAFQLRIVGGPLRNGAATDLDTYAGRVAAFQPYFIRGVASAPVDAATWIQASGQIMNLYMLAFTLQSTMPPGEDLGDGWGNALLYSLKNLPATVGNAIQVATGSVTNVAMAAVWGFVKGTWPLLLAAGAGLTAYVAIQRKVQRLAMRTATRAVLTGSRHRR